MSIEVVLFILIGLVAVGAAVGMLITPNAVHSALFLIMNFACVAFLYLLLDAPFLALVQVAVYAGAIMVLFLFVIMLLGAERTLTEIRQFRWLAPVTLTLALAFLTAVGLAFDQGQIDEQPIPAGDSEIRIVNALPDFDGGNFYLGEMLFASEVAFGGLVDDEPIGFEDIEPGVYSLLVATADNPNTRLPLGDVTVGAGEFVTVVAYGVIGSDVRPAVTTVVEDMSFYLEDGGRFSVVNAYDGTTLRVVDAGPDRILDADEAVEAEVILESVALGEASEMTLMGDNGDSWVVVAVPEEDDDVADEVVARPLETTRIEDGASNLWIVALDRVDDSLRPTVLPLVTGTLPQFGSAEAIGAELFTGYVLPFELVAMLLLAAMVGAIVLTQRGDIKPKPGRPTRRKVSRPLTSVIATQTGQSVSEPVTTDETTSEPTPEPAGD